MMRQQGDQHFGSSSLEALSIRGRTRAMLGRRESCHAILKYVHIIDNFTTTDPEKDSSIDSESELETSSRWTTSCGDKEFFRTEGAVVLLSWIEGMESVLHISKCPAKCQVEFASCMLQGRALTWWNTLVQTRGWATAMALSWEDLKNLLMEEYFSDDAVQKLEEEF
ncbi:reverse transcriptase domain-containing protein [Tanacetum coccineum]